MVYVGNTRNLSVRQSVDALPQLTSRAGIVKYLMLTMSKRLQTISVGLTQDVGMVKTFQHQDCLFVIVNQLNRHKEDPGECLLALKEEAEKNRAENCRMRSDKDIVVITMCATHGLARACHVHVTCILINVFKCESINDFA